jgi:predicted amidohydrolase YtcJ
MSNTPPDRLIRVGAAHSMTGPTYRAVAVRGTDIVAVSDEPDGLDHLAGATTTKSDCRDLTLLPAFADAHEHLMESARNSGLVAVDAARSIAEFTAAIAHAAGTLAPGQWIQTSNAWHESNLAEHRLPTRADLDAAIPAHPVLARRGGHLAVANSAALRAAAITAATPDPPGGGIGRDASGEPTGVLEGSAVYRVQSVAPAPTRRQLVDGLRQASAGYAVLGVGTIREAMITREDLDAYRAARDAGALQVRVRPLIRVPNDIGAEAAIRFIRSLGTSTGDGDEDLRVWGLKLVMDGGVEGGALEEPYTNNAANSGHINWDLDVMYQVCLAAVRDGWRIGTHAAGDRAVRLVIDVYERVIKTLGDLPPATLVIEHALLAYPTSRPARSASASASPCNTPCCGTWAAKWSPPGDRTAPPGSTRWTSGLPPARSSPPVPTSSGRSTRCSTCGAWSPDALGPPAYRAPNTASTGTPPSSCTPRPVPAWTAKPTGAAPSPPEPSPTLSPTPPTRSPSTSTHSLTSPRPSPSTMDSRSTTPTTGSPHGRQADADRSVGQLQHLLDTDSAACARSLARLIIARRAGVDRVHGALTIVVAVSLGFAEVETAAGVDFGARGRATVAAKRHHPISYRG